MNKKLYCVILASIFLLSILLAMVPLGPAVKADTVYLYPGATGSITRIAYRYDWTYLGDGFDVVPVLIQENLLNQPEPLYEGFVDEQLFINEIEEMGDTVVFGEPSSSDNDLFAEEEQGDDNRWTQTPDYVNLLIRHITIQLDGTEMLMEDVWHELAYGQTYLTANFAREYEGFYYSEQNQATFNSNDEMIFVYYIAYPIIDDLGSLEDVEEPEIPNDNLTPPINIAPPPPAPPVPPVSAQQPKPNTPPPLPPPPPGPSTSDAPPSIETPSGGDEYDDPEGPRQGSSKRPKKDSEDAELRVNLEKEHSETPTYDDSVIDDEVQTSVVLHAVDIDSMKELDHVEFTTNLLLWTYTDLDALVTVPQEYRLLDPPENDFHYYLTPNETNEITLYYRVEQGPVIVIIAVDCGDGVLHMLGSYDILDLGPLKEVYTLGELTNHYPLPSGYEYSVDRNIPEYEIPATSELVELVLIAESDYCTEPQDFSYLVRHWAMVNGQLKFLDFEIRPAKPGDVVPLQSIAKNFLPLYSLAGIPPNRAAYMVSFTNNVIDLYYRPCYYIVSPPDQCENNGCMLGPPIVKIEIKCPGFWCWQETLEILVPPTEVKPPYIPKPSKPGKPGKPGKSEKIQWNASYDVIVYGLDAAGAVAAITAAEEGAAVLVVDRNGPNETGGYTKHCPQQLLYSEDEAGATKFFKSLRGDYDHLSDEHIKALATGSLAVPQWLKDHGASQLYDLGYVQYEELPGGEKMKMLTLHEKAKNDRAFYNLLLQNLLEIKNKQGKYKQIKGSIKYSYNSNLINLIQDPKSKAVLGIEIKQKGKNYKLEAKGGVILAAGGFEANEEMIENFLQLPEALSRYGHDASGDAIRASMKIGADLWHMGNVAGYDLHFKPTFGPDKIDKRRNIQGYFEDQLGDRSCFVVGPNGRRFTDESAELRLGHWDPAGNWVAQQIPPRAWVIFDEPGLTQAPLYPGWSNDNQAEVKKGWLLKADSIKELAAKLGVDPDNLEDQFLDYQDYCKAGYDSQLHRPDTYLKQLTTEGPYYALAVFPTIHHSLGGPRKNAAGQVLDIDGKIIPGLYSAGNIGSFFADIYPEGGDLSECIIVGRIAGTNAAKKK
ncbi:MAG: FAD-binding protein [Eubacteriales bacterium]|nr:FAD-binding protein [Eubacteriales bacterium]